MPEIIVPVVFLLVLFFLFRDVIFPSQQALADEREMVERVERWEREQEIHRNNARSRGPLYWYFEVLKKYAVFNGRARRQEFWMFMLVDWIINIAFACLQKVESSISSEPFPMMVVVGAIYTMATLLPSLAVTVRRLHDVGQSGWWICAPFLSLIP